MIGLLTAFLFAVALEGPATTPTAETLINQAAVSIKKGDLDAAEAALKSAAQLAADDNTKARALYYMGSLTQKRADAASSEADRVRLRQEALDYYKQSRTLNPAASAPVSSTASVLFAQGKEREATQVLADAVENKTERYTYFAEKLGDYHADKNEPETAAGYYRIAAGGSNTASPRGKLIKALATLGAASDSYAPQILTTLSEAWRAEETDSVLDGAVVTLQSAKLQAPQVKTLFGFIAGALSKKNYDYEALVASEVMGRLFAVRDRKECPDCATPVDNIRDLYLRNVPSSLDWWRVDDATGSAVSAASGMRALLRTLGTRAISEKDYALATTLFQTALKLVPSPDFEAANGLLATYYARQDQEGFRALDNEVRQMTEHAKTSDDWEALYEYHRTVGDLYVSQRKWSDSPDAASAAISHLRQASSSLERTNDLRRQSGQTALHSDPALYNLLGQAYAAGGQMPDSIRALVQSAEELVDTGNQIKARDELWPVAFRYVPDDLVGRYTSVLGSGVAITSSAKLPSKTDSLRGMLSIVARPKDAMDKDRALKLLLSDYGVTDVKVDADGGHGQALLQTGEVIAFKIDVNTSAQKPMR